MKNKFDIFFESLKDTVLKLRMATDGDIIGASDAEIEQFEKDNDVKYPMVMHSFLRFFGNKAKVISDYYFCLTLSDLRETLDVAKNFMPGKTARQWLDEQNPRVNIVYLGEADPNETEDNYTPIKDLVKIDDITFLRWDSDSSTLSFFDHTKENPDWYLIWGAGKEGNITSANGSLIGTFRSVIFLNISLYAENYFTGETCRKPAKFPPLTDFEGFEWLKVYIYIYRNLSDNYGEIIKFRNCFSKLSHEKEKQGGQILTIGEFEIEFQEYLRQNGLAIPYYKDL